MGNKGPFRTAVLQHQHRSQKPLCIETKPFSDNHSFSSVHFGRTPVRPSVFVEGETTSVQWEEAAVSQPSLSVSVGKASGVWHLPLSVSSQLSRGTSTDPHVCSLCDSFNKRCARESIRKSQLCKAWPVFSNLTLMTFFPLFFQANIKNQRWRIGCYLGLLVQMGQNLPTVWKGSIFICKKTVVLKPSPVSVSVLSLATALLVQ